MVEGSLLIRARVGDRVLEVVPHTRFLNDLPAHFIHDFVHWADLATGVIEFRPFEHPWVSSNDCWRLNFLNPVPTMQLGQHRLIDPSSSLADKIVSILSRLEHHSNIHMKITDSGLIEVDLPRLALHFFVNTDGHLESREYGAIVDSDQSFGAFVGLVNKLVLRTVASGIQQCERSVLVPHGKISTSKTEKHVTVSIGSREGRKVHHSRYILDHHLRRLKGSPDLLSTLYKAYLHAVTSGALPDPFTGLTGTEEALRILNEESVRTCDPLELDVLSMLNSVAKLTPYRTYYPAHLQQMQQVEWNLNLSSLVQNEGFFVAARDIVSHADRFAMLYDKRPMASALNDRGKASLLARASIRNATYRNQQSNTASSEKRDHCYAARDCQTTSERARRVYEVTQLIKSWPEKTDVCTDLSKIMQKWGEVSGFHTPFGVKTYSSMLDLPFSQNWGSLFNLCRASERKDTYNLIFLFGAVTFGTDQSQVIIRTLLSFAFSGQFKTLSNPSYDTYNLNHGLAPDRRELESAIQKNAKPFNYILDMSLSKGQRKRQRNRQSEEHHNNLRTQTSLLRDHLMEQWPCRKLSPPADLSLPAINLRPAMAACHELFAKWYRNRVFLSEIAAVQEGLDALHSPHVASTTPLPVLAQQHAAPAMPLITYPRLNDLLKSSAPKGLKPLPHALTIVTIVERTSETEYDQVQAILANIQQSHNVVKRQYVDVLHASIEALKEHAAPSCHQVSPFATAKLEAHRAEVERSLRNLFDDLVAVLTTDSVHHVVLKKAGLWPRLTPSLLLTLLSSKIIQHLPDTWRAALVAYGTTLSLLQRAERLVRLSYHRDLQALYKELQNTSRQGWTATDYPDWLLLEIENNITIRPVQAQVAMEMISPASRRNCVMQLNMGEGKSSVIVPMVSAALANSQQLLRVVTLKPLLRQTQYLLSQRLGGLVNRRIYYMPFSRKTKLNSTTISAMQAIYEEIERERGVLLILPEQILSFRLMGRERLESDRQLAVQLIDVERWLQQHCRDVLDESDEILDTKFQLIYTVGSQRLIEGHPDRWTILHDVLSRVADHAATLCKQFPAHLSLDSRGGGCFPTIKFLQPSIGTKLVAKLVEDIQHGLIGGLSLDYCSNDVRAGILTFIEDRSVSEETANKVLAALADTPRLGMVVLLLRGLIGHRILQFALEKKRWMVEYGLDPSRCLLAVPYRAKGVPSVSSEFGHPDVAILLTSLSYYYTGLHPKQLQQCLSLLLKESNAVDEYASWCEGNNSLPNSLRAVESINLDDKELFNNHLYPCFRYNKRVADFFMSKVVFPREGKEVSRSTCEEFPHSRLFLSST